MMKNSLTAGQNLFLIAVLFALVIPVSEAKLSRGDITRAKAVSQGDGLTIWKRRISSREAEIGTCSFFVTGSLHKTERLSGNMKKLTYKLQGDYSLAYNGEATTYTDLYPLPETFWIDDQIERGDSIIGEWSSVEIWHRGDTRINQQMQRRADAHKAEIRDHCQTLVEYATAQDALATEEEDALAIEEEDALAIEEEDALLSSGELFMMRAISQSDGLTTWKNRISSTEVEVGRCSFFITSSLHTTARIPGGLSEVVYRAQGDYRLVYNSDVAIYTESYPLPEDFWVRGGLVDGDSIVGKEAMVEIWHQGDTITNEQMQRRVDERTVEIKDHCQTLMEYAAAQDVQRATAHPALLNQWSCSPGRPMTGRLVAEEGGIPIRTAEDLLLINNNPAGDYYLANDIDLNDLSVPWIPLGSDVAFSGTLDGGCHIIDHLYIDSPSESNQGFFARISGGEVYDLAIGVRSIHAKSIAGALAGSVDQAFIGSVTVFPDYNHSIISIVPTRNFGVIDTDTSIGTVGGIIGYVGSGSSLLGVSNFGVNVEGISEQIGGAFGYQGGFVLGVDVISQVSGSEGGSLGGVAGKNRGRIHDARVSGAVQSNGSHYVGGLVGWNEGDIEGYSNVETRAYGAASMVGGLVGVNLREGRILGGRSVGPVSSVEADTGGLVGCNFALVRGDSSSHVYSNGRNVGGLVGCNTGEVQGSASGNVKTTLNVGGNIGGLVGHNYGTGYVEGYALGWVGVYDETRHDAPSHSLTGCAIGLNAGSNKTYCGIMGSLETRTRVVRLNPPVEARTDNDFRANGWSLVVDSDYDSKDSICTSGGGLLQDNADVGPFDTLWVCYENEKWPQLLSQERLFGSEAFHTMPLHPRNNAG